MTSIQTRGILSSIPALDSFRAWLSSQGNTLIYDISEWNNNGSWKGWNLGEVPPNFLNDSHLFLMKINGSSPVHLHQKDIKGWGATGYTVREGYKILLSQSQLPRKVSHLEGDLECRWTSQDQHFRLEVSS
jgi:hypothetical protein